jgi:PAS domain S-box-containing protein
LPGGSDHSFPVEFFLGPKDQADHLRETGFLGAAMITFQSVPEAFPIAVAAVFSSVLAVVAWRRRAMPMAPAFATMMAGETLWALGAALEPLVVELAIKRLLIDLRILGVFTAILGLLAFVLRFTGLQAWSRRPRFAAICAGAIPLIALAWTDPLHHLYWSSLSIRRIGTAWIAIRSFGPGFWAILAYCYAVVATSIVLLVQAVFRSTAVHRTQAAVMLFGVLLPGAVEILDMTHMLPSIPVDLVSPTFAVTGLCFLPALFRWHLLDLPPVAWVAVVEGMDDPVVVIDPWRRIVKLNPAAERLFGRSSAEAAGALACEAFSHWPALVDRVRRVDLREQSIELAGPDRAVESPFDLRISPLGDHGRPFGWVLVLRDIGGIKRAEQERLRTLREQAASNEAEAANRAKDRFLATLSHELRTPLTPVLATVSAMLDDNSTPESFRTVLEMIRRNVFLEAQLIDDLLDRTRIRSGNLRLNREPVDAHELVERAIDLCREDLRKAQLDLTLDLSARQREVNADPGRLQQVFWNLLKNAIKFTPPGGRVTVRSRDAQTSPDGTRGPTLILEVSDTGIGIEPGLLPRIFDVIEDDGVASSSLRPRGLGLGLLISRSVIEHHRGRLTASSPGKNRGATFTVEIPAFDTPRLRPSRGDARSATADGSRAIATILLVEDNADIRNSLSRLLTQRGHVVYTGSSMEQALEIASQVEFEILISDIDLPDGSGLELLWKLRSRRSVAGIALSGFGSPEDVELSRAAGFVEHLTKPVNFHQLASAIDRVADHGPVEHSFAS